MHRIVATILPTIFLTGFVAGQEPDKQGDVRKLAESIASAVLKGDHARVIDQTYEKVVEMLGGRDSAIKKTEEIMDSLRRQGITLKSYEVGRPGSFYREGGNTFVVVPTKLEMVHDNGRIVSKSYLLGISCDGGTTWKFVDGAGLANEAFRQQVLPKLPTELKLPKAEPAEIIPN